MRRTDNTEFLSTAFMVCSLKRGLAATPGGGARPLRWPILLAAGIAVVSFYLVGCGNSSPVSASSGSPAGEPPTSAAGFAFQPITIQRIDLPGSITGARWPGFTTDGQHLLFWSGGEMWITDLKGNGVQCLTCGLANDPSLVSGAVALATFATPFPDGKRVLVEEDAQILSSGMVVLECAPSVVDCQGRQLVPVDYSAAEPTVIPPGGAVSIPQIGLPHVAAHAQLSPDGNYVGFSQARSDSIEAMIVGKLQKTGAGYVVADPRVINRPGPASASDPDVGAWSNSSSLFEFKTFTNGGADATYVQVGGPHVMSTNVWSVNLATGKRTQLTAALGLGLFDTCHRAPRVKRPPPVGAGVGQTSREETASAVGTALWGFDGL